MSVRVVTDSVASIPRDLAEEFGVEVVSLFINDGESNRSEVDIDLEEFYQRLERTETLPTSSQPSVESMLEALRAGLAAGDEVLGVFISEKMSGTLQAARVAGGMLAEEFPDGRVELLDSGSNSMEEGYGVLAAAKVARSGGTIEECVEAAESTLRRTRYLFTPHTLEYLRRGGRIGGASALVGGLLQIRPILTVEGGETQTVTKVRTQTRALAEMTRLFAEDAEKLGGIEQVCVHYISDLDAARAYAAEQIEPLVDAAVPVVPVSPVIGLHVGPAVGLVYTTNQERR